MATTRIADLIEIAARLSGISISDITGPRRFKRVVRVRQAVIYVARSYDIHSFPQIGNALGGRDHTTIMHGLYAAGILLERDADFRKLVENIQGVAAVSEPFLERSGVHARFRMAYHHTFNAPAPQTGVIVSAIAA